MDLSPGTLTAPLTERAGETDSVMEVVSLASPPVGEPDTSRAQRFPACDTTLNHVESSRVVIEFGRPCGLSRAGSTRRRRRQARRHFQRERPGVLQKSHGDAAAGRGYARCR